VNFSERVPSNAWTDLTHQGEAIAEAWFKPEGEPLALLIRVPRARLEHADLDRRPTAEDLLTAAAVAIEAVESWQFGDESQPGLDGANPELKCLLPPPPPGADHLTIAVRLKPPAEEVAGDAGHVREVRPETWQALEGCWKTILGLEAVIDSVRLSLDGLRAELEAAFKKSLTIEEKINASQADVVQWNKAKSRAHYALPKAREFIHRATWAAAIPERKRLEELVRSHIEPRVPLARPEQALEQMGHLQKDRQLMIAQGNAVSQECRGLLAEIQRAVSTLQRNAADTARKKRSAGREKGKHF
jgi:hypothetical protein